MSEDGKVRAHALHVNVVLELTDASVVICSIKDADMLNNNGVYYSGFWCYVFQILST
mgnify:CR=1 FL=1